MISVRNATVNPRRQVFFYVPVSFPTERFLDNTGFAPDRHTSRNDLPYAHYLTNLLHWRGSCCWRRDEQGWTHLDNDTLRKYVPKERLTTIKHRLMKAGVIESDFVARWGDMGSKAYGYRLKSKHLSTHRVPCGNYRLTLKILTEREREDREMPALLKWLKGKLGDLSFDVRRAGGIIAGLTPKSKQTDDEARPLDDYRNIIRGAAERIAGGDLWFVRDEFGRVHTPITSLPSALRCCLTIRGENLVGIDLNNSQPLFLGLAAQRKALQDMDLQRERDKKFPLFSSKTNNPQPTNQPTQPTHPYKGDDFQDKLSEIDDYLRVCMEGQFYETLAGADRTRQQAKDALFVPLFGECQYAYRGWLWQRFEGRFPAVARFVRDAKSRDYRRLAYLMQGEESAFFIDRCCGRIMRERPDLPLLTIHDSLVTLPEHVKYVQGVIDDEFAKMDVVPTLEVDPWGG